MKRFSTSLLSVLILASTTLFVSAALAQRKHSPPARKVRTENHPKIQQAISALKAAKFELEQSGGDFGGHKAEAIEAVNNALKRLRLALQFDKY